MRVRVRVRVRARVKVREDPTLTLAPTLTLPLPPTLRRRVALVYGEDLPVPLGAGLPLEGIQRPAGSAAPLPSLAEAAQWGVVFQRELYDAPTAAGAPAHAQQTLAVPGLADARRGFLRDPYVVPVES